MATFITYTQNTSSPAWSPKRVGSSLMVSPWVCLAYSRSWEGCTCLMALKTSAEELFLSHISAKAKFNNCWTKLPVLCEPKLQEETIQTASTLYQLNDVYSIWMWGDPPKTASDSLFPPSLSPSFPPHFYFFKNNEVLAKQSPTIWLPWCLSSPSTKSASPFKENPRRRHASAK